MDHSRFAADTNPASQNPTTVSLALCAASRLLARLVQRRVRRLLARKASQEFEALPNEILRDIGLRRVSFGEFSLELGDRLRPRR